MDQIMWKLLDDYWTLYEIPTNEEIGYITHLKSMWLVHITASSNHPRDPGYSELYDVCDTLEDAQEVLVRYYMEEWYA